MIELLRNYIYTLKAMQDCGENLYSLNHRRTELHSKIIEAFGISKFGGSLTLKTFTDTLDKVCESCLECKEWDLQSDGDVDLLAEYLKDLLTSGEAANYLELLKKKDLKGAQSKYVKEKV